MLRNFFCKKTQQYNSKQVNYIKRWIAFICIVCFVLVCIVTIAFFMPQWLLSLIVAAVSYILVMNISFYSISTKISQKILEANEDLENEKSQENLEQNASQDKTQVSKQQEQKKILKFLDLSKVRLGFELSFSLSRIFAFGIICVGFIMLIYYGLFYPVGYILGIILGAVLIVGYLLTIKKS